MEGSTVNPYAPPAAPLAPVESTGVPTYKLYTANHAGIATFLGSPLAGFWIIAANRRRVGQASRATKTLLAGVALTAGMLALGAVIPDAVLRPLPIVVALSVQRYATTDAELLAAHEGRHGLRESGWKAAGVGLIGMVAIVVPLLAYVLAGIGE